MKTIPSQMELDFEAIDAAFRSGRAYGMFDRDLSQLCDFLWGRASSLVGGQVGEDLVQKFLLRMSEYGGPSQMGFDPRRGNPKLVGANGQSSRSFKAWLSTAIWNEARDHWRARQRPRHAVPAFDESFAEPDPDDPIINGMSGLHGALHFKWVRPSNTDHGLGNQFTYIDNYMFWKMHGWIDKVWDRYRAAKGKTPNDQDMKDLLLTQCRQINALVRMLKPSISNP